MIIESIEQPIAKIIPIIHTPMNCSLIIKRLAKAPIIKPMLHEDLTNLSKFLSNGTTSLYHTDLFFYIIYDNIYYIVYNWLIKYICGENERKI